MTILKALAIGATTLIPSSDNPSLDTERLLLHVLNKTESSWLYTHSDTPLTSSEEELFLATLKKRQTGLPLAYVLGFTEFYGRRFIVTPDVLIPRPETEELVRQALDVINALYNRLQRPITIADIGTGSGCIAITLALEAKNRLQAIYATDISPNALKIAQQNAEQYFSPSPIIFKHGDLLADINPDSIDLIISNPPYVPTAEVDQAYASPTLETAGLQHEPRQALDGGLDGQDIITRLIALKKTLIIETTGGVIRRFNF